eukprot:747002-Rhodomonas_salina.1
MPISIQVGGGTADRILLKSWAEISLTALAELQRFKLEAVRQFVVRTPTVLSYGFKFFSALMLHLRDCEICATLDHPSLKATGYLRLGQGWCLPHRWPMPRAPVRVIKR